MPCDGCSRFVSSFVCGGVWRRRGARYGGLRSGDRPSGASDLSECLRPCWRKTILAWGSKIAINAFGKKNFLGTFAPPYAVINDFSFLESLSDRDWRGGMAEAVKVALIKDRDFFEQIEQDAEALANRDMPAMKRLVHRCAQLHLEHISSYGDPFEQGSSRPLDFGHWGGASARAQLPTISFATARRSRLELRSIRCILTCRVCCPTKRRCGFCMFSKS